MSQPMFEAVSDPLQNHSADYDDCFIDMLDLLKEDVPMSVPSASIDTSASIVTNVSMTSFCDVIDEASVTLAPLTVPSAPLKSTHQISPTVVKKAKGHSKGALLTTEAQATKRERNRQHVARSRLRKRNHLTSLQQHIHDLEQQLTLFKATIQSTLPEKAASILDSLCRDSTYTPHPVPSGFGPIKTRVEPNARLVSALDARRPSVVIADTALPDHPIVHVSDGFLTLTGYTRHEIMGRPAIFLQGPDTNAETLQKVHRAIADGIDISITMLCYRANGSTFWNQFYGTAVREAHQKVLRYIGIHCEVSDVVEKATSTK